MPNLRFLSPVTNGLQITNAAFGPFRPAGLTSLFGLLGLLLIAGCQLGQQPAVQQPAAGAAAQAPAANGNEVQDIRIVMSTTKGEVEIILFASRVPMTVANFVNLIEHKFYDGLVFHRVIQDFMAQVGDPLSRDPRMERRWGTGDPGYKFPDEIDRNLRHNRPGILSMANSGPNTNGSQIFITHVPTPHLDGKHAVFGAVTKGQEIVNAIQKGDKIIKVQVMDDSTALLQSQAANVAKWNAVLEDDSADF